jgi:CRISPR-associated protein Cmr5
MHKNLEQIRAINALDPAATIDKSAVNKLPAMILTNGLLATAAFCESESDGKNRSQMAMALDATADHLAQRKIVAPGTASTGALIRYLVQCDSGQLQRATDEALAYIGYLRRFATKKRS